MKKIIVLTAIILFFSSCSYISTWINDDDLIAQVGDKKLYKIDLVNLVKNGAPKSDSLAIVEKYVETWISKQLLLSDAENKLINIDIDKEIAEFRELLLLNKYEYNLFQNQLDTLVTKNEINRYYEENKAAFPLIGAMLQISYIPITYMENKPKEKLKLAFKQTGYSSTTKRNNKTKEPQQIKVPFSWQENIKKVLSEIDYNAPLVYGEWQTEQQLLENYENTDGASLKPKLSSGAVFEMQSEGNIYLTKVINREEENSISPISYVQEQIKSIILNQRKAKLLIKTEQQLYKEAEEAGKLKYNVKKQTK